MIALVALLLAVSVAAVAALAALVRLRGRLAAAEQQVAELEADLDAALRPSSFTPTHPAGRAVKAVVGTAAKVREHGVTGVLVSSIDDLTSWALENRPAILRVAAPDGTVAVFFSDIEGSTELNHRLGDRAWVKLLAAHDAVVRNAVDRHRGQVVKTQGDGFMVVFRDPESAVSAGRDIHRALERSREPRLRKTPVTVRIGVHVGPVISRDGDYFGRNVAMAARIGALAAGGEILVSSAVRESLADSDVLLEEAGDAELKGLPGRHPVWRVG